MKLPISKILTVFPFPNTNYNATFHAKIILNQSTRNVMTTSTRTYCNTHICLILLSVSIFLWWTWNNKRSAIMLSQNKLDFKILESSKKWRNSINNTIMRKWNNIYFSIMKNELEIYYIIVRKINANKKNGKKMIKFQIPVWGGCLSGRIRCWKFMIHTASAPNHLSDTARM